MNTIKGEVQVEAGGKTYTLVMSVNAYCAMEKLEGLNMETLFAVLQHPEKHTLTLYRSILYCALQEYHPDASVNDAGRIMSLIGLTKAMPALLDAVRASMPMLGVGMPADGGEVPLGQTPARAA